MAVTFTPMTTTFVPTVQNGISVAGVTTAATAYDWFATAGGGGTAIAAIANAQNKLFGTAIAQQARACLLPMVKAELFAAELNNAKANLQNSMQSAYNALTSLATATADAAADAATKTALSAAYTAEVAGITAQLNRLKSLEAKIYAVGDSYDVAASGGTSVTATFNATATLTTFTGAKTYVAGLLDPAVLGNSGTAIPALTATTYANATTLATIYNNAYTAISTSNVVPNFQGEIETAAKAIFDTFAIMASGYASTNTSGTTGTPVGLYAGIDYELSTVGEYQAATGAPGTPVTFWGADHGHTW
jgi:hypothetical protein